MLHRCAVVLALIFGGSSGWAADIPQPPEVDAKAHLLIDMHTARVIAEHDADQRLEVASLTKMMTSYVVFAEMARGKFGLSDQVLVSEKAWRAPGSRMFIEVGTHVSVEQLLKGVIVQSGNDASVALAEFVAGDESAFADLMNHYAQRLGMSESRFVNASGLPGSEQYSTARDMARIAVALIRDFPEYYPWHAIREYEYGGIKQPNRNPLLNRDDSVDGLKTGHTVSAGYCLVVAAEREGMRLIAVVMGADSSPARRRIAQSLINYGFRFYETRQVYASGMKVVDTRVWKGVANQFALGLAQDLYVTTARGKYDEIDVKVEYAPRFIAPIRAGDQHGTLRLTLGEEMLADRPLVALDDVAQGGLWRRAVDHVQLMLEK